MKTRSAPTPHLTPLLACLALGICSGPILAAPPAAGGSVSRAEYERLKLEHDTMKQELAEMKSQLSAVTKMQGSILSPAPIAAGGKDVVPTGSTLATLQAEIDELKQKSHETTPGTTGFLLAGYGAAGFTSQHGHDSFFTASFNPIFLWKLSDRILFEGELEMELEGSETSVKLEMAQASYILNDYVSIGIGKFLNPTNSFVERQHMAWVNKLPDKPLAVYDGLTPETLLGAQIRGAIPIGSTIVEYSLFGANAPHLITTGDTDTLGKLDYDNFDNTDGHIAFGGHVGFLPIPQLEIGYGIEHATVGPRDRSVNANLQSVDLNIVDDSALLKGLITFRAQWIWSSIGRYTYETDNGPLNFSNNRNGGYVQLSYRPSRVDHFCKDLEPVVRFDTLNQRGTPGGYDEKRWTAGLNYWFSPSTVFKAAYQWDSKSNGFPGENAFMLQVATGF